MQVLVALNLERGEQRSAPKALLLMPPCITQNWARQPHNTCKQFIQKELEQRHYKVHLVLSLGVATKKK